MKILALELSSARGSIACREAEHELFASDFANDRKHSGVFFENLQRCLREIGKVERIVVGLGPGSYAGTRIAIATATGLQAALGAALIGLPSARAMPTDAPEYGVIGDARRQALFFVHVRERLCVQRPALFAEEEMRERLLEVAFPVFTAEELPQFPMANSMHPSASILAQIATNEVECDLPLEPIYLREPHITQPRALTS